MGGLEGGGGGKFLFFQLKDLRNFRGMGKKI
jgi:hypothetical protein